MQKHKIPKMNRKFVCVCLDLAVSAADPIGSVIYTDPIHTTSGSVDSLIIVYSFINRLSISTSNVLLLIPPKQYFQYYFFNVFTRFDYIYNYTSRANKTGIDIRYMS